MTNQPFGVNDNPLIVDTSNPLPVTVIGNGGGPVSPGAVPVNQAPYDFQIDYLGGTNASYIGYAIPKSATSAGVWQIRLITYDGNNNPLTGKFANGSGAFSFIWDNRASYSYS